MQVVYASSSADTGKGETVVGFADPSSKDEDDGEGTVHTPSKYSVSHYSVSIACRDEVDGVTKYSIAVADGAHTWTVERRYTEFDMLHNVMARATSELPPMPDKSFWRRSFLESFQDERQKRLEGLLQSMVKLNEQSTLMQLRYFLGVPRCTEKCARRAKRRSDDELFGDLAKLQKRREYMWRCHPDDKALQAQLNKKAVELKAELEAAGYGQQGQISLPVEEEGEGRWTFVAIGLSSDDDDDKER